VVHALNPCRGSGSPMSMTRTALAIALILLPAAMGFPQTPQAPQTVPDQRPPDFRVQIWGDIGGDFSTRVRSYADLRSELEKEQPGLRVTDDPVELWKAVRGLAQRIRVARAQAKQGDVFTPIITAEFRKALVLAMDANTWAVLMDENPGEAATRINGTYPVREPFTTVPPNVLAVLPRLPDDIEYRLMGRDLILLDTRANVIIDRIHHAIRRPRRHP
jgi:hypothetical protein